MNTNPTEQLSTLALVKAEFASGVTTNNSSLTKEGQCNPADMILDIILSGNIFFGPDSGSNLTPDAFTPLCFSHGLNFGGDPTRINQLGGSGFSGSLTWPPVISFPYVLPMAGGAGNSSGSAFQILADPPAFDQGPFESGTYYNVNAIVKGSDGNYYRALCSNSSDPVSGGNAYWAPYSGPQIKEPPIPISVTSSGTNSGTGTTVTSATITPLIPNSLVLFFSSAAGSNNPPSSPPWWNNYSSYFFTQSVTGLTPVTASETGATGRSSITWNTVILTMIADGTYANPYSYTVVFDPYNEPCVRDLGTIVEGQAIVVSLPCDAASSYSIAEDVSYGPMIVSDNNGNSYELFAPSQTVYTEGQYFFSAMYVAVCANPKPGPTTVTVALENYGGIGGTPNGGIWILEGVKAFIPVQFTDGLTDVRDYCHANNIYSSVFLTSQRPASDVLTDLCEIANCTPVWNGQVLDFYPYSEVPAVGGGFVYTPRTAAGPIAVLDLNYFVADEGTPPVTVKQENMQSVVNILDINYMDAGWDVTGATGIASYQSNSVRICDVEHASVYGPMNGSPRGFDDYLTDATTATTVGWPIMKRQRFADPYSIDFDLPQTIGSLLDPMDLITVVDPLFGGMLTTGVSTSGAGQQDARISELSEDNKGTWTVSCERFMYGASAPNAPSVANAAANVPVQANQLVASVNAPYFFEPTAALAVALSMSAEGGVAIAVSDSDPNYGGCIVNVSTDGGESYNAIGTMPGNSNMGVTYSADYLSAPNPDTTDTLYVNLTESDGELDSYSTAQQNQLVPLMLLDNSGSPGTGSAGGYTTTIPYEIIAYGTTTLTSAFKYSMAPTILRGQLGTVPADHPLGSPATGSVAVDLSDGGQTVFKYIVPNNQIAGNVLYFKFQSMNQLKTGIQDISDCTPYTYTLTGQTNPTSPTAPTGGGSYTVNPSPCLYQGRAGGWSGIDPNSGTWTFADNIYFPAITVNYGTGSVSYDANDEGTVAFTGPGQQVFVCIYDPTLAGGTPTVDVQPDNSHALTPGYIFLGSITSAAAPTVPGSPGGSNGPGGPGGGNGTQTYAIEVNGVLVPVTME